MGQQNGFHPDPAKSDGESISLCAGPLEMRFVAGEIRRIRLAGKEVVRRIYGAVRDANWNTVPNRVSGLILHRRPGGFDLSFRVENQAHGIDFRWKAEITGDEHGNLTFSLDGQAWTTFLKNRIGLCLLHDLSAAGRRCTVTKLDGSLEEREFPRQIAPHQPFLDLRGLRYEAVAGCFLNLEFEGDTFETEDQRNWGDASFKTYSTPLRLPFPAEIQAGTRIRQVIRLSLPGGHLPAAGPAPLRSGADDRISFSVGSESRLLPLIGLSCASHGIALSPRQIARIRSLNLSHLRVDIAMDATDSRECLHRAVLEAKAAGVDLEAALILSDTNLKDLQLFLSAFQQADAPIARWLVFHRQEKSTSIRTIRWVRQSLPEGFRDIPLIAGTNAFFAELNRGRPDPAECDGACFSLNPQVHASDNDTIVENLAAQAETVHSAAGFLPGLPVFVTPITFRIRFNPNASGDEAPPHPGELPSQVDPRQASLLGAAWTAGSIKYLAEAGAAGATYFETTGWRGVMETEAGCPLPGLFPAKPGSVFPLFHVLRLIGEFRGGWITPSLSQDPLSLDGFVLRSGARYRIVLANFTGASLTAEVDHSAAGGQIRIRHLDETNVEAAMLRPEEFVRTRGTIRETKGGPIGLEIRPFGLAVIDFAATGSAG